MKRIYLIIALGLSCVLLYVSKHKIKALIYGAPNNVKKVSAKKTVYDNCELVTIPSTSNNEAQKAFFFKSTLSNKQPLVISLHTWGGTYLQEDSVLTIIKEKKWNYIHPDYGGPQWLKNSCCFDPSINYIDDAIDFAIKNSNVDTSKIIIIGKSGGGSGVLGSLLKSKYNNLHGMCWSPITDYIMWHHDVQLDDTLNKKYYEKIMLGTHSKNVLDTAMAKLKSPYYFNFKKIKNNHFKNLTMYVGIRDGLDNWSTSISQPINFYNKFIKELGCKDSASFITLAEHKLLLEKREKISTLINKKLGNRPILYQKSYKNAKIILFKGGHEILVNAVNDELNQLEKDNGKK